MKHARDERRWTNLELEADPEGYRAAQQARREDQAAARALEAEEADRVHFVEMFVAAGGSRADAERAWRERRNEQAERAAEHADEAARRVHHGAVMRAV